MAGAGDEMAAAGGNFLASHADRERVVDTLKVAFEEGRLTKDELEARVAQALGSRTYAELAVLTADIPADLAGAWQPRRPVNLTPAWWGIGVFSGFPPILLATGFLTGNRDLAGVGVGLFILDFILAVLAGVIAIGTAVDNRMKNPKAAAQPPPGPGGGPPGGGPRRLAFGQEPARPEAWREARREARRDDTGAEARSAHGPGPLRPLWQAS
jgi:Domain of unknown function (DUF1707)